jgi:predicted CxxxxCH...CXXCH cytochrome family protein
VCHLTGLAGTPPAPAVPADHSGRTNAQCTACHLEKK